MTRWTLFWAERLPAPIPGQVGGPSAQVVMADSREWTLQEAGLLSAGLAFFRMVRVARAWRSAVRKPLSRTLRSRLPRTRCAMHRTSNYDETCNSRAETDRRLWLVSCRRMSEVPQFSRKVGAKIRVLDLRRFGRAGVFEPTR